MEFTMQFRPWKPKGKDGPYIRYYACDDSGAYIEKKGGRLGALIISGGTRLDKEIIHQTLIEKEIDLSKLGLTELNRIMEVKGLIAGSSFTQKKASTPHRKFNLDLRSNTDMHSETMYQDVTTCKFKASTKKNGYILVDHREPNALFKTISNINISNIQQTQLELGDILIGDSRSQDLLLIERKTVTDLKNSIISNHAHDQAERYYDKQRELEKLGIRMQVIWIVEGEAEGQRMLYNALDKCVNMDGWLNYIATIVNQQTIQSFNSNHTAYLIAKLAQGFIERELYYKVKSGNPLINRVHTHSVLSTNKSEDSDHGVTRAKNNLSSLLSYIPAIKSNVANELSKLDKSFAEITQMSIKELLEVKGIGKVSAQEIYDDFNKK
jgi:ERCC4-type nuclease